MRPSPTFITLQSGVKIHYRKQGKAGAPWLVLLNGLLSDLTLWAGVLPFLSPHFRVLTFDFRGQGHSDMKGGTGCSLRSQCPPLDPHVMARPSQATTFDTSFGDPYSVSLLAEDTWEMLGLLGIEYPCLVGLSNGSSVSLELLSSHPGAFRGAVLTSAMPCIDFTTRLKVLHWIQCLEVGGPLMLFDAVAPYLWGDRFLEERHHVLRAYHQVVTQGRGDALNQMKGILDWDVRPRLHGVKDPVLLLAGAEDLLTPPWKCLETAKGISHSRFEMVPSVGHAFPVEAPRAFASRVLGHEKKITFHR